MLTEVPVRYAPALTFGRSPGLGGCRWKPTNGGPVVRLAGHRLTIYRRQPDGRWLLARDAHTLAPVTEAGA